MYDNSSNYDHADPESYELLIEADRRFQRPFYSTGKLYWDLKTDLEKRRITGSQAIQQITTAIFNEFSRLAETFEQAYIAPLRAQPQSELLFPWLLAVNKRVVDEEIGRAQEEIASRCRDLGSREQDLAPHLTRVRERGERIKAQNETAINHLVRRRTTERPPAQDQHENSSAAGGKKLLVFVSHTSADADLARALVELLRSALNLPADEIRCTSVDGYRLPVGAHSEMQLRNELLSAEVFLGLVTPESLRSTFVLFELGARWGAKRYLIPVLAGIEPKSVHGPLAAINALSLHSVAQIHQLIEDVARHFQRSVQSVSSYVDKVEEVLRLTPRPERPQEERRIGTPKPRS